MDPEALAWLLVVLLAAAALMATALVVARVSGWQALATSYRYHGFFEGASWRFQDLAMRHWINYSGCVSVGASDEGLYLAVFFRVAHPPLLIPWQDLTATWREARFLWWRQGCIEFVARQAPAAPFWLRDRLMMEVAKQAADGWSQIHVLKTEEEQEAKDSCDVS